MQFDEQGSATSELAEAFSPLNWFVVAIAPNDTEKVCTVMLLFDAMTPRESLGIHAHIHPSIPPSPPGNYEPMG